MKKALALLAIVLIFNVSNAQELTGWDSQFPYEKAELLLNREIKVNPKEASFQKFGYKSFYTTPAMKRNSVYKSIKYSSTPYEALNGKIFTVKSIEPFVDVLGYTKQRMELVNEEIGTLWYNYSSEYAHAYPFSVLGELGLSSEFICSKKISKKVDKFDGTTTYRMLYTNSFMLIRIVDNGSSIYYLKTTARATTTGAIGNKGLSVLFENDKRLDFPDAKLEVEVEKSKYIDEPYRVEAFVRLTEEQLSIIKTNKVMYTKLYIFESDFTEENYGKFSTKIINGVNCLISQE